VQATAPTFAALSASRPSRIGGDLSEATEAFGKVKWFSAEKGMGFVEPRSREENQVRKIRFVALTQ
jgi:hypothetical protein